MCEVSIALEREVGAPNKSKYANELMKRSPCMNVLSPSECSTCGESGWVFGYSRIEVE